MSLWILLWRGGLGLSLSCCFLLLSFTMPQFKFCFHLESKMSAAAAAPASSPPRPGPSPHCMWLRWTPSLPSFNYLLGDMTLLSSFEQTPPPFFSYDSFAIDHAFLMVYFTSRWFCFVWEVCVFVHLPSCGMLSDVCSRLLTLDEQC